ncbi:hypothetical protein JCM18694_30290 [Prolixibacter denitrificans]|uniref:6-bladed beta-propeller protein n=1 Tax=Prolixibacter denitrificans TaxID=1541063 RepID=A0ABQ0ZN01_9BACT|nr:hypothetical protein JCM18694_30290 [Prolixibacter denitrificans]
MRTIDLVHAGKAQKVNLSQFASGISYIPLSTSKTNLLNSIFNVVRTQDSYIISDFQHLFQFSPDGQFQGEIGHKGKGPREFIYANDFSVDQSTGLINVLGSKNIIQVYGKKGEWVKTIKIDKSYGFIMAIQCWKGNLLCSLDNSSGDNPYELLWLNSAGNVIKAFKNDYTFKKEDSAVLVFMNEFLFYPYDGKLEIKGIHSDTVQTFHDGGFTPRFVFEQGQEKFTPEVRGSGKSYMNNSGDYIFIGQLFETSNYLWTAYGLHQEGHFFVVGKDSDKQFSFDAKTGLTDDLDGGPNFIPKRELTIDGQEYLLGWITPLELKTYVSSDDFSHAKALLPEKKRQLEALADRLNENDNPVLVLARLKD